MCITNAAPQIFNHNAHYHDIYLKSKIFQHCDKMLISPKLNRCRANKVNIVNVCPQLRRNTLLLGIKSRKKISKAEESI